MHYEIKASLSDLLEVINILCENYYAKVKIIKLDNLFF